MTHQIHLQPEARLDALPDLIQAVDAFADAHKLPSSSAYALTAAVEELLTNTMMFGFAEVSAPEIAISLKSEDGRIICEICDNGKRFDPNSDTHADTEASGSGDPRREALAEELLRQTVERLEWRYEGGRNYLLLEYPISRRGKHLSG